MAGRTTGSWRPTLLSKCAKVAWTVSTSALPLQKRCQRCEFFLYKCFEGLGRDRGYYFLIYIYTSVFPKDLHKPCRTYLPHPRLRLSRHILQFSPQSTAVGPRNSMALLRGHPHLSPLFCTCYGLCCRMNISFGWEWNGILLGDYYSVTGRRWLMLTIRVKGMGIAHTCVLCHSVFSYLLLILCTRHRRDACIFGYEYDYW